MLRSSILRLQGLARALAMGVAIFGLLATAPAAAQFSDAYNFLKAVKDKDGAKATELLDKPGNTMVNTRDGDTGETALHIVTRRGDLTWVGFLVGKGANVNVKDREGNTPLIIATIARWSEGVALFAKLRADVNAQNRLGETALLKAVQGRDSYNAKALLDAGANPDISDSSGISARSAANEDPRAASIARLIKDVPVRAPRPVQGPSL
jgi:ankyrin repeat protein